MSTFVAGIRRRSPVNADMAEALQDTRWLSSHHRARLAAGKLRLPDQANHFGYGGHPAVLVSVPDGFGSPVAWIDKDMAELVSLLNRRGIETVECCQGGPGGMSDEAGVWFVTRRGLDEFMALAGDSLRDADVDRTWLRRDAGVRFPHRHLRRVTRAVRNA